MKRGLVGRCAGCLLWVTLGRTLPNRGRSPLGRRRAFGAIMRHVVLLMAAGDNKPRHDLAMLH